MNPYEPPPEDNTKYEPPVVDMRGMIFTFIIFILIPFITIFVASLCMD